MSNRVQGGAVDGRAPARVRRLARLAALLCAGFLVLSCAGLQRSRDNGDGAYLAGLVNSGQAKTLSDLCAVPFLLDGEILLLPADVGAFWREAIAAGFRMEEPTVERAVPVTPDSYKEFADSMEVKTFFRKYVGRDARLIQLASASGKHAIFLVRSEWTSRKLYGFKGPF